MLLSCLAVGTGGFLGSVLRYLLSLMPILNKGFLPFHTLIANVLGAFLIGLFIGYDSNYEHNHEKLLLLFKVGLCGGFTTFSTFAFEATTFFEKGQWLLSILYIFISITLCILGVFIGKYVMSK